MTTFSELRDSLYRRDDRLKKQDRTNRKILSGVRMKILLTGGTGYIGSPLMRAWQAQNHQWIILTRRPERRIKSVLRKERFIKNLDEIEQNEEIDCIINLAGSPIDVYWTKRQKSTILTSRIDTTAGLAKLVKRLENPPKLCLSASAIGYYGKEPGILDETSGLAEQSGSVPDFAQQVCCAWEEQARKIAELGVPTFATRLGVVLGPECRFLKKILPAFRLGLGGPIGHGQQYFSWVHVEDVLGAFSFLLENYRTILSEDEEQLFKVFNLTSPHPVTNEEWTKALAKQLSRPAFMRMPKALVSLIFGEMGRVLLLQGPRVVPKAFQQQGFQFCHPHLAGALEKSL